MTVRKNVAAVIKGILWEGKSRIDGTNVVVLAIGTSENGKTGDMVQTYILNADIAPILASRIGADRGICGDCPHRGTANPNKASGWADNRTCYVNLLFTQGIFNAYARGSYPHLTKEQAIAIGRDKMVRLGSYGDPAAVPESVFSDLLSECKGSTGYTHQSTTMDTDRRLMVSADSLQDAQNAWENNRRTFRVVPLQQWEQMGKASLDKKEILCPASNEAGKRTTCEHCGLCDGTKAGKNIAIIAHGTSRKKFTGQALAMAA